MILGVRELGKSFCPGLASDHGYKWICFHLPNPPCTHIKIRWHLSIWHSRTWEWSRKETISFHKASHLQKSSDNLLFLAWNNHIRC